MTRGLLLLALCAVIGSLPFTQTAAQEQLPAAMSGRWLGMGQKGGKIPIDFAWSVAIAKQSPDGSIEGTMSYAGPQCSAKNAPMTGTFDGTELKVTAELQREGAVRNANLPAEEGRWEAPVRRQGAGPARLS